MIYIEDLQKGSHVRLNGKRGIVERVDFANAIVYADFEGVVPVPVDELEYLGTPGVDAPYLDDLGDNFHV